jgi:hypothetical protein
MHIRNTIADEPASESFLDNLGPVASVIRSLISGSIPDFLNLTLDLLCAL